MKTIEQIKERFEKAIKYANEKGYADCNNDFEIRELLRVRAEAFILEWVLEP